MVQQNVKVSEETAFLCNINDMLNNVHAAIREHHERFDNPDEDTPQWQCDIEDMMQPIKDYVERKLFVSIKECVSTLRLTL